MRGLVLVTALLLSLPSYGTPSASFGLDSRYVSGQSANEAVADFGLQYHEGIYKLYHLAEPTDRSWRVLFFLGSYLAISQLGLESSWFLSNHEYGHASRADAYGQSRTYVAFDDSTYRDFLPYFVRNLFGRARSGSVSLDSTGLQTKDVFIAFAAGMNNSSYFAERIDAQIRGPASSYMYLGPTVQHRLDAFEYAVQGGADIDVVLQYYQGFKGYSISRTDVKIGSLVSLFASNTFWSTLIATGKGLYDGNHRADPLQIGSVELPNFLFYLTSRGISLKASAFWHLTEEWKIEPGLEAVYQGESWFEPSARVWWKPHPWAFSGALTISRGAVLELDGTRWVGPWFFGGGAKIYSGETMLGERLSPDLTAQTAVQGWVRAGFRY